MRYPRIILLSVVLALAGVIGVAAAAGNTVYVPMVGKPAPPPATATPPAANVAQQLLDLTNAERSRISNCPALVLNPQLTAAAQTHAADMATNNFMEHAGSDGSSAGERALRAGYGSGVVGENIAAGYATAQSVFTAWMRSGGHRDNLLNCSYTETGIGYQSRTGTTYTQYWTHMFARP